MLCYPLQNRPPRSPEEFPLLACKIAYPSSSYFNPPELLSDFDHPSPLRSASPLRISPLPAGCCEASMGSGARRSNMYPIGRSGAKRSSGAPGGGCTGGGRVGPDAQSCWPCPHASATSGASRRHRAASASSSSCCPLPPQARAALCVLKLVLPLHNKVTKDG